MSKDLFLIRSGYDPVSVAPGLLGPASLDPARANPLPDQTQAQVLSGMLE